jgi:isopentenyl diphosphate isomerase/L-lactate dehydrogenase-like FMN-dependent dehydrogenase
MYLASSPLLASAGCSKQDDIAKGAFLNAGAGAAGLIRNPGRALDVFDFQAVARNKLPIAHYGYLATGVDGETTLRANEEAFSEIHLRPRRLVDVSDIDMGRTLFGEQWETPIVLAPVGSQNAFHAEGELGTARAARSRHHLQILSSVTTNSVEDVTTARSAPVWYQLYPTSNWEITKKLLRRAEGAGAPVVVLTVDLPVGSNRLTDQRARRRDPRDCSECHDKGPAAFFNRKPMYEGTGISGFEEFATPGLTWEFVQRLQDFTSMKLVIKGIVTREDAQRCLEYGVDGVIVSNHGGRAEESGMATIASLPEIAATIGGRIPVMMDSGIRRGTDIFKALALGADAICIGRPYLWGLAAFGQPGVEKVLDLLSAELKMVMEQMGTPTLDDINPSYTIGIGKIRAGE